MELNIEQIREYCLRRPGEITEEFPFDEDTLAFKVHGKIFLLTSLSQRPLSVNLKCDPELAVTLRKRYEAVQPGYHMNKKHWNTVVIDGGISRKEVLEMIDHSYDQVVRGLSKSVRDELARNIVARKG